MRDDLRSLCTEHIGGNERDTEILNRLAELDEVIHETLAFEDTDESRQLAGAA